MAEINIPTAVHYPIPLDKQPAYQQFCSSEGMLVANKLAKTVMSLPMSPYLNERQQENIVHHLVA